MKIAIMQPYFIPYAGYFRLFCAADLFVIYDCVQFPRRSFVHRNKLYTQAGELEWVTMPLMKQAMDTRIKDLIFREDIASEWLQTLAKFPAFTVVKQKYPLLYHALTNTNASPVNFMVSCLREICKIIDIPCNIAYSTEVDLPIENRGQQRILALAKHYGASEYINSPGGRDLYQEPDFEREGIKLRFLPDFQGDYYSIIQCLADREPTQLKEMLYAQSHI